MLSSWLRLQFGTACMLTVIDATLMQQLQAALRCLNISKYIASLKVTCMYVNISMNAWHT